ncbi:MAG TPA: carboxypeptidase regulatory-like domain-containing protein, partial [Egibacteraceae bacterium]|nr:carboxypeptidase regulatory-like domain-containing protein [Egibacteraceae bacterium]
MEQRIASTRRLSFAALTVLLSITWVMTAAPPADAFGSSEPPPLPAVSAGGYITCGVAEDGTAVCWGQNEAPTDANTGVGMATPPTDVRFREVNAGYGIACGVTTSDTVVCWGNDRFGQVTQVPAGTYTHVVPGLTYVCALRTDGTIACWGGDTADADRKVVRDVPTGTFTQLTLGIRHACALAGDGTVVCWGHDTVTGGVSEGQTAVPPGTYSHVNAGNFTTCAVRSTDGTVVCWGRNQAGQVTTVPAGAFTQVSVGFAHVCGLRPDGTITCWGRNAEGQATPPPGTYTHVSTGTFHSCAMPTSGPPAVCWGNNQGGRVQPSMSNTPPPQGTLEEPYSHQLTMDTHVAPPPTFTVTAGQLPPGLTLDADGRLSGTPTAAGSYTFTVVASSLGMSPPDCVAPSVGQQSLPCTPGDPQSVATATRVFTVQVVGPEPGAIAGRVTDASTGAAVGGATVTVTDAAGAQAGQTTTDPTGNYLIEDLSAGQYTVTVRAAGYQTGTQGVTVTEGATATADFVLQAGQDPLRCGDVITEDTTLEADLGPCPDNGLIVGADNVTLDLGGHTIFGTDAVGDGAGVLIDNRTGVTVRNGTIRGFDGGVA